MVTLCICCVRTLWPASYPGRCTRSLKSCLRTAQSSPSKSPCWRSIMRSFSTCLPPPKTSASVFNSLTTHATRFLSDRVVLLKSVDLCCCDSPISLCRAHHTAFVSCLPHCSVPAWCVCWLTSWEVSCSYHATSKFNLLFFVKKLIIMCARC